MNIAIIGGGHIGGACALGLAANKEPWEGNITVSARRAETLSKFEGTPVRGTTDNALAVKDADTVIFSVRTDQMQEAVSSVKDFLKGKTVVCMAAQVEPALMQRYIGEGVELIYVIPNTAAAIGQSMTFISSYSASEESMRKVDGIFLRLGRTMTVPIELLPAGISLASCGIGYAFNYIAAAVKGGMRLGFSQNEAHKIVIQTVLGAAAMQELSKESPEVELAKVATRGGITEKGVLAMEEAGFTEAVIAGLCIDTK